MCKQIKYAIFFCLSGLYLFIVLMVSRLDNLFWIHATQEHVDFSEYIVYIIYFFPTLCVYTFGLVSTWYCAGCLLFMGYILVYYPVHAVIDRIVASGLNIILISMLLSLQRSSHDYFSGAGGRVGYIWYNIIKEHTGISFFLIQLMILACCVIMFRFSWISCVYRAVNSLCFLLQKTPILTILHRAYFVCCFNVKLIIRLIHRCLRFCKIPWLQKYNMIPNQISFDNYQSMIHDIGNYMMLSFESNNEPKSSLVSDVDKKSNDNELHSIVQQFDDTNTSSKRIEKYEAIPSLFFDMHSDDKLVANLQKEADTKISKLEEKLERFGIYGRVTNRYIGPLVTVFEYEPHVDTKLSKILMLEDDLAMVLQAMSVRILAPIPGKSVVGFEVANTQRQSVWFKELFVSTVYQQGTQKLPLILGSDTAGKEIVADLAAMPHLLIAGSTGSGKSVALNSMLISLLSKRSFHEMKLILIDPKRLEFMSYAHIPHLIFPIITHPKKAVDVLKWLVQEMDRRYEAMAKIGARDCQEYNKKQGSEIETFPFIVVVVDEFADLMITVKKDIEDLITRIAQMARAAGIHMIIATQRPSVDVITGLIKVNFTSRIALRVASKIDSRTILDTSGAERLLAKGDMLFLDGTVGQLKRVHGPFISSQEIERAVKYLCTQGTPTYYDLDIVLHESIALDNQEDAMLYQQVLAFIQHTDKISISLLQRQFKIGYNRSARIIEALEHNGLIMPADGAKVRRVIR